MISLQVLKFISQYFSHLSSHFPFLQYIWEFGGGRSVFTFQSPGGAHDPQCSRKSSTSQHQGRDVPSFSEQHPSLNKRSYSATDLKESTKAKPNPNQVQKTNYIVSTLLIITCSDWKAESCCGSIFITICANIYEKS